MKTNREGYTKYTIGEKIGEWYRRWEGWIICGLALAMLIAIAIINIGVNR